ncbi:MAG: molybdopterin converting factor subunit 1 [Saprospiraceae bacterium]|jgi:molybdopterin synthase sulfur carrier subunit
MVIKCFGIARDIFESDELIIDKSVVKTVSDLRSHLNNKNEQLNTIKSYFIAVNQEYAQEDQIISDNDEIAIIPPVSGG